MSTAEDGDVFEGVEAVGFYPCAGLVSFIPLLYL